MPKKKNSSRLYSLTNTFIFIVKYVLQSKGEPEFTPVNTAVEAMVPSDCAALHRPDCCGALLMDLILMWLWLLAFVYLASVAYVNHKSMFECTGCENTCKNSKWRMKLSTWRVYSFMFKFVDNYIISFTEHTGQYKDSSNKTLWSALSAEFFEALRVDWWNSNNNSFTQLGIEPATVALQSLVSLRDDGLYKLYYIL